ncbi:hypothetical protein [Halovivax gelatinilyticus]|uniref:hypothetical protein n=1 Tax=Halovivax gelatinilyticus TaxID=2961597 RepID=UPI0020CA9C34|nr:hypothetical protein [Halovivax gelatinilyticus]
MTEASLAAVEDALDRATALPAEDAEALLRSARENLAEARTRESVDREAADYLETRLEQRLREIDERDAYDAGMGAAMEPDDEDAP